MAQEVERKFLVGDPAWRVLADDGTVISQFYLASAPDRSVRIRIRNGEQAVMTLKFGGAVLAREEFEYAVPLDEAREMERFALGNVVEKIRYVVAHRGRLYEIDVFKRALAGLVIAELETAEHVADDDLPAWLGQEVTGEAAFYNVSLALHGLPEGM